MSTEQTTDLINLERYPIHKIGAARDQIIADVQLQLAASGCAILKKFLTSKAIERITHEADSVAAFAHKSYNRTNAYFSADDPALDINDPRRRFFDRSNAFIPADHFDLKGPLRQVHDFPAFDPFIRDCLQQEAFYRYADPLADVIINMANEGNGFPWHFDTNPFTITLAIQNADHGGAFEYAPNIRRQHENFGEVSKVLDEQSDRVISIDLEPGDLQLFLGRYSLHRVTPLKGKRPRYVAIFSYVDQPDMVGSPERARQLYGRVLPIHLERAGLRADTLAD